MNETTDETLTITPSQARRNLKSVRDNGDWLADDVILACKLAILYKRPVTIGEARLVYATYSTKAGR